MEGSRFHGIRHGHPTPRHRGHRRRMQDGFRVTRLQGWEVSGTAKGCGGFRVGSALGFKLSSHRGEVLETGRGFPFEGRPYLVATSRVANSVIRLRCGLVEVPHVVHLHLNCLEVDVS